MYEKTLKIIGKSSSERMFSSFDYFNINIPRYKVYIDKISNKKEINTTGNKPIILYKKDRKMKKNIMIPILLLTPKSQDFFSDGGLHDKLNKFSVKSKSKNVHKSTQKSTIDSTINKARNVSKSKNVFKIKLHKKRGFSSGKKSKKSKGSFTSRRKLIKNLSVNNIENDWGDNERKIEYMNKLIENSTINEIRHLKSVLQSPKNSDCFLMRKKEVLRQSGIEIDDTEITENEGACVERKENSGKKDVVSVKKKNDSVKFTKEKKTKFKRFAKPKIDQFEYYLRIHEEQVKLNNESKESNNKSNGHYIGFCRKKLAKNRSCMLSPSNLSLKKKEKNKYIKYSKKDLRNFTLKKENELRNHKMKLELEKNKRLFFTYRNLYNLEMRNYSNNLGNKTTKNRGNKSRKCRNLSIKFDENNTSSTKYDLNEYYLNIVESHRIMSENVM